MISIRPVHTDDPLAVEALSLPSRVGGGVAETGDSDVFLVAVTNHPAGDRPAGCIAVRRGTESGDLVITRFGIDPQMRGLELRRKLIAEAEMLAFGAMGATRLRIHALPSDKEFFLAMGWDTDSEAPEAEQAVPMAVTAEAHGGPAAPAGE